MYIMKRRGPRTEPYGTPYEEVCEEERVLPHLTRKERTREVRWGKNPVDDSAMELEAKPRWQTSEKDSVIV